MQIHLPITSSVWGSIHKAYQRKPALATASQGTVSCFESKTPKPIVFLVAVVSALATPIFILLDAIYFLVKGCRCPKKNFEGTTIEVQTTKNAGSTSAKTTSTFTKTAQLTSQTKPQPVETKATSQRQDARTIEQITNVGSKTTTLQTSQTKPHAPVEPKAPSCEQVFDSLEKTCASVIDEEARALIDQHRRYGKNVPKEQSKVYESGLRHICYMRDELASGSYTASTKLLVLKALLKMTLPIEFADAEAQSLSSLSFKENEKEWLKSEHSLSGQIAVVRRNGKIIARLREDRSDRAANLKKTLASCEVDRAMGVKSANTAILKEQGLLVQPWIQNGSTLFDIMDNDESGAEKLRKLDLVETQMHLLSGLVRCNADGHGNNTMVFPDAKGMLHLVDVDPEQEFRDYNYDNKVSNNTSEGPGPKFAAMGLPQGSKAIPKILLMLFSWDGLKEKTVNILRRHGLDKSIPALEERWDKLQEIMRFESTLKEPKVTIRDLYFALFGKDYLFEEFLRKGYAPFDFFGVHVESYDDNWPRKPFSKDKDSIKHKNLDALDPCSPPKFSMKGSEEEGYPGSKVIQEVSKYVMNGNPFKVIKIEPGAFDAEGWNEYQRLCKEAGQEPKSYMLSHFLQGLAKRIARKLAHSFSFCTVRISQENGESFLEVEGPAFIKKFIENFNRNPNKLHKITEIDPKECDFEGYEKGPSRDVRRYLIGKSQLLAQFLRSNYLWAKADNLEILQTDGRLNLVYNDRTKE